MIGSQRYGATALVVASSPERLMPRFPGFEQMAFFAGAYWEYSWRETGITNGKVEPESSGVVRIDLSDHIDVDFGPAGALRLFETSYSARTAIPWWWPRWHYLGVRDGTLYAAARLEGEEYGAVTIFDSKTGEVHPPGFMGWFSSRRGGSVTAGPIRNSFLVASGVVVEELSSDPESETFGGVRICDGELHDYKVREFYLPGKGFAGWSRSGKSTYAGGGYVDIFEMAMEVGLTATNL